MIDASEVRKDLIFLCPETSAIKMESIVDDIIKESRHDNGTFIRTFVVTELYVDMTPGTTKFRWDLMDGGVSVCSIDFGFIHGLYYITKTNG